MYANISTQEEKQEFSKKSVKGCFWSSRIGNMYLNLDIKDHLYLISFELMLQAIENPNITTTLVLKLPIKTNY